MIIQTFLDFRGFDFCGFRFNAVYNSILFSSPLVLITNLDFRGFASPVFLFCPHINCVNRGMPLLVTEITEFNQLFVETAIQSSNFQVMIFKNLEQIGKWFYTKEYIVNSCMFVTKAMHCVWGI